MLWQPQGASCWRLMLRRSLQAGPATAGVCCCPSHALLGDRPFPFPLLHTMRPACQSRSMLGNFCCIQPRALHLSPKRPMLVRAAWKTPAHPLRKDPRFQLGGIPTLVHWKDGAVAAKLGE